MDFKRGEEKLGRVVFELFDHDLPHTCENFKVLCNGEMGANMYYVGTRVHRVVPRFMLHGGDISHSKDGKGGKSIFEEGHEIYSKDGLFEDENVWFPHSHKGVLSMNNNGKNTNGSQFMISLRNNNEYFDEKHTVFGRIIKGWEVIE